MTLALVELSLKLSPKRENVSFNFIFDKVEQMLRTLMFFYLTNL